MVNKHFLCGSNSKLEQLHFLQPLKNKGVVLGSMDIWGYCQTYTNIKTWKFSYYKLVWKMFLLKYFLGWNHLQTHSTCTVSQMCFIIVCSLKCYKNNAIKNILLAFRTNQHNWISCHQLQVTVPPYKNISAYSPPDTHKHYRPPVSYHDWYNSICFLLFVFWSCRMKRIHFIWTD